MLLESINKQRKLMGLNELLDANIDAKGALSGNKLDLGIVPLEEMDPDDELADDPDAQEMKDFDEIDLSDFDEIDLSDVDSSDDVNRHPDEYDFYRQQPGEDLSDTMDSRYPDPNERDWQMNRYSGMDESNIQSRVTLNQMKIDEGFGDFVGGLKNVGNAVGNAVGNVAGNAIKGGLNKAKQIGGNIATAYKEGSYKTKVANVEKQINTIYTGLQNYAVINDQNLTKLNDVKTKLLSYNPANTTDKTQKDQLLKKIGLLITTTTKANSLLNRSGASVGSKISEDIDEGLSNFLGGLSNVGKSIGTSVGNTVNKAGNAIGGVVNKAATQLGSKYNVGALNSTVNGVEKTMNKSFIDMKNFLDKNSKVYNDIQEITKQVQMLQNQNKGNQQLQTDLNNTLNKLNKTNSSLTYLRNFLNKQATNSIKTP